MERRKFVKLKGLATAGVTILIFPVFGKKALLHCNPTNRHISNNPAAFRFVEEEL